VSNRPPQGGISEHFDEWAPRYDAEIRSAVPRYDELHDTVVSLLSLRPPRRVLDLGSGTGTTALRLLTAFPAAHVTGLDVSPEMLARAAQRLAGHAGRFTLRRGDIAAPDLAGEYDAIVSVLTVHHLWPDEKRHLFRHLREHTARGGVLVLADVFRPTDDLLREAQGLPREVPPEDEPDRPDTAGEQVAWLAAAGFAAVDVAWKDEQVGVLVARRGEDARP
jgi:tRNA (cmo5U34)-methyltransferase